jgi:hypothetical protein
MSRRKRIMVAIVMALTAAGLATAAVESGGGGVSHSVAGTYHFE